MTITVQTPVVLRDNITSRCECEIYIYENDTPANCKFSRQGYRFLVEEILKQYLGVKDQSETILEFNDSGRPYVNNKYGIDFNYSHSKNGFALVIVNYPNIVGIDMEDIRRQDEISDPSLNAFSIAELRTISGRNCHIQQWCLKEAAVKMHGTGFLHANPQDLTCINEKNKFELKKDDEIITSGNFRFLVCKHNIIAVCSTARLLDITNVIHLKEHDIKTIIGGRST